HAALHVAVTGSVPDDRRRPLGRRHPRRVGDDRPRLRPRGRGGRSTRGGGACGGGDGRWCLRVCGGVRAPRLRHPARDGVVARSRAPRREPLATALVSVAQLSPRWLAFAVFGGLTDVPSDLVRDGLARGWGAAAQLVVITLV